jgi:hypothetical protein
MSKVNKKFGSVDSVLDSNYEFTPASSSSKTTINDNTILKEQISLNEPTNSTNLTSTNDTLITPSMCIVSKCQACLMIHVGDRKRIICQYCGNLYAAFIEDIKSDMHRLEIHPKLTNSVIISKSKFESNFNINIY